MKTFKRIALAAALIALSISAFFYSQPDELYKIGYIIGPKSLRKLARDRLVNSLGGLKFLLLNAEYEDHTLALCMMPYYQNRNELINDEEAMVILARSAYVIECGRCPTAQLIITELCISDAVEHSGINVFSTRLPPLLEKAIGQTIVHGQNDHRMAAIELVAYLHSANVDVKNLIPLIQDSLRDKNEEIRHIAEVSFQAITGKKPIKCVTCGHRETHHIFHLNTEGIGDLEVHLCPNGQCLVCKCTHFRYSHRTSDRPK